MALAELSRDRDALVMTTAAASRLASSRVAPHAPPAPRKFPASVALHNFLGAQRGATPTVGGAVQRACPSPLLSAHVSGPALAQDGVRARVRATKKPPAWDFTEIEGTGVFAVGTVPLEDAHLDDLVAAGVTAVVSLNQRYEPQLDRGRGGVRAACRRHGGLAHLWLPTPDYTAPTQRDIRRAVRFIGRHVARGGGVYVHCNAGRGRSAVCALAYIMEANGIGAQERTRALRSSGASRRCRRGFAGCRVRSGARCGARSEREPRRADTTQIRKILSLRLSWLELHRAAHDLAARHLPGAAQQRRQPRRALGGRRLADGDGGVGAARKRAPRRLAGRVAELAAVGDDDGGGEAAVGGGAVGEARLLNLWTTSMPFDTLPTMTWRPSRCGMRSPPSAAGAAFVVIRNDEPLRCGACAAAAARAASRGGGAAAIATRPGSEKVRADASSSNGPP